MSGSDSESPDQSSSRAHDSQESSESGACGRGRGRGCGLFGLACGVFVYKLIWPGELQLSASDLVRRALEWRG